MASYKSIPVFQLILKRNMSPWKQFLHLNILCQLTFEVFNFVTIYTNLVVTEDGLMAKTSLTIKGRHIIYTTSHSLTYRNSKVLPEVET